MYKWFITVSFLLPFCYGFSQQEPAEDPFYTNSPNKQYLNSVLAIDVLRGRTVAEPITPTGQKLCFDKIIKVKMRSPKGPGVVCVFINTKIGLIAYTTVKQGVAVSNCDIKPELPDFSLNVIGLKGNIYSYINMKKKGVIEKWVMTGHTNTSPIEFAAVQENEMLYKKDESREYCGGKVKGWAYKYQNRPETWFLFGKNFPDAVVMQPTKYLGNFGIGFQYTDKGVFIIMQVEGEGLSSEIIDIDDGFVCFDPSPYKKFEEETYVKMLDGVEKEKRKLDREVESVAGKPCQAPEMERINFQKQAVQRREQAIHRYGQESIYQSSTSTQKARMDMIINYDDVAQLSILETRTKLCKANEQLARTTDRSTQSARRLQEKISCLNKLLSTQARVQTEIQQVSRQYANDPGRAYVEKARIFVQGMSACD